MTSNFGPIKVESRERVSDQPHRLSTDPLPFNPVTDNLIQMVQVGLRFQIRQDAYGGFDS